MTGGPAPGHRSVLLLGLPRSGSTWIGHALGAVEGVTYVHEPDNDVLHRHALAAKGDLGLMPMLDRDDDEPGYARLFTAALRGPRPTRLGDRRRALAERIVERAPTGSVHRLLSTPGGGWTPRLRVARAVTELPRPARVASGTRVVKSVHAMFAVDFLVERVRPDRTAVLLRHPANVVGSMRDLGWQGRSMWWGSPRLWERHGPPEGSPRPHVPSSVAERRAWQVAMSADALLAAAEHHDLPVVDHEDLLDDPVARLGGLADRLGLPWDEDAAAWVRGQDQPGEGYEVQRVAADERDRWRDRLPPEDAEVLAEVLDRYPRLRGRWPWS